MNTKAPRFAARSGVRRIDHLLSAYIMRYSPCMATERVNLTMDKAALTAARVAADAEKVSLSEWLSKAAWTRAIEDAARVSAEQDRHAAGELPGWEDDGADRIFGQDAA